MDIQFVPREQSIVLDKRRPVDAALRKLQPGQIIVVCPANRVTQHTFSARARVIGLRIETALDGNRLEVALLADRPADAPAKVPRGHILETVRACIRDAESGIRLIDIAHTAGMTPQQAKNATNTLSRMGAITRSGRGLFVSSLTQ